MSDPVAPVTPVVAGAAGAELWRRRARSAPAIVSAAALTGEDPLTLADATAISLAASAEAGRLLDGMELRVRTLKTTVATSTERCIYSVRGPVLWSETITARANALGNEDVFVCMTAERSFDTVENRVLVQALEAIARAGRALRGPTGERVDPAEVERIAAVAEEAQRWRRHPRLSGVRAGRLNGRSLARMRGGHRLARLAPVLAVRRRVAEPFVPDDIVGLSSPATRGYHEIVLRAVDAASGGRPRAWTCNDGALRAGPVSFRHPAAGGSAPAGLWVRGTPVIPDTPDELPEWWDRLPANGLPAGSPEVAELLSGLSPAPIPR